MNTGRGNRGDYVAIIGMAGRFPDAENLATFWRNLEQGVESLVSFSDEELQEAGVDAAFLEDPNFVKKGTYLQNADMFDAAFFGFNPRDAEVMDPQHRVFLECAWEALEDSGYGGDSRTSSIGVYAGASLNTYLLSNLLANPEIMRAVSGYQLMLGNDKDFLATRVSYKLNLKGPSITLQTACSTSLVAVQVACQALLANECEMALAGGVSIGFPQKSGYLYTEGMIFSPDGHCCPFDAQARGTRSGSGAGIVVLKRLADAIRDRDSIRAVIRGAAINNDGSGKMGYTAPSVEGQADAIAKALQIAGVTADSISYIEAHGTATPVGDPIEFAALDRSFRAETSQKQFCAVGSLKSNIGHLDVAAGIAGLIKATLALQHRRIPPTLHFREPNPQIDFVNSPFYVNNTATDWKTNNGSPLRAGVSSFGIGGTNAHVVLEEAPAREESKTGWPDQLLVLSAKSEAALDALTRTTADHLTANADLSLADACYTLQVGRRRWPYRRMLVASTRERAIDALTGTEKRTLISSFNEDTAGKVVFMFSGQGSQHIGMAKGLYQTQPVYREYFDACAETLIPELSLDICELLYGRGGKNAADVNATWLAQPVLFAVEYALAQMWMSWGVTPDAMIGHSVGEYVAACLAGVFEFKDALRVVATRGRIMQSMPPGNMIAATLSPSEISAYLNDEIAVAAVNAPSLCTFSGPADAMATLENRLRADGIESRLLHTSHAFHSRMMEPAAEPFHNLLQTVTLSAPRQPFISNLTGTWIRPDQATDPTYWVQHLRQPVRFSDGILELSRDPNRLFVEIGPGRTLATFTKDTVRGSGKHEVLASLPHPKDLKEDRTLVLETAGRLWLSGVELNWEGLHMGESLHRVSLPTYPFERQRFYCEPKRTLASTTPSVQPAASVALVKKPDIGDWFYIPSWSRTALPTDLISDEPVGPWLIFNDESGFGDRIVEHLSKCGSRFITVDRGKVFSREGAGLFRIDPLRGDDYNLLLQEIQATGDIPRGVIYLWGLPAASERAHDQARNAFHSLLLLAQAIGERGEGIALDFLIVSSGMQIVNGREISQPEQALMLGPSKVIPEEYPGITCRSIDLALPLDLDETARVIENLLLEPGMPQESRVIAYRDGFRWEQSFEPVHLPVKSAPAFRERGTYLITGGFGGIGLTLAKHLAGAARARLALIGRSAMPPRTEWKRWIEVHGEEDSVSRKIRDVRQLEDLGAEVLPLSADVSNWPQMDAALRQTRESFGPIHGVIHAAGIVSGGIAQLKTKESADSVLAPKLDGTLILDSLLREEKLDFFILCSSIDAIRAIPGAIDYCAANAFLDAFALSQSRRMGIPVTSINWDSWREVGMAAAAAASATPPQAEGSLTAAISPAEGAEAFRRIIARRLPQVAVVTRDFPALLATPRWQQQPRALLPKGKVDNDLSPAREVSTAKCSSENATQHEIAEIWQQLLGIEQIGIDDNFFDLGGHSLLATGILSRLRQIFGVHVPLRAIFEAPTVRELADRVDTLLWATSQSAVPVEVSGEREEFEL